MSDLISCSVAARSTNETFALILIDINRFKLINDTYSQAVGDSVLRASPNACGAAALLLIPWHALVVMNLPY
jgi:diguanylate cyclase (GGDEF)-like protein